MNPRGAATLRLPSSSLPRDPLFQVSVLGCPDPAVHEIAYQYGKNVGTPITLPTPSSGLCQ